MRRGVIVWLIAVLSLFVCGCNRQLSTGENGKTATITTLSIEEQVSRQQKQIDTMQSQLDAMTLTPTTAQPQVINGVDFPRDKWISDADLWTATGIRTAYETKMSEDFTGTVVTGFVFQFANQDLRLFYFGRDTYEEKVDTGEVMIVIDAEGNSIRVAAEQSGIIYINLSDLHAAEII